MPEYSVILTKSVEIKLKADNMFDLINIANEDILVKKEGYTVGECVNVKDLDNEDINNNINP